MVGSWVVRLAGVGCPPRRADAKFQYQFELDGRIGSIIAVRNFILWEGGGEGCFYWIFIQMFL